MYVCLCVYQYTSVWVCVCVLGARLPAVREHSLKSVRRNWAVESAS